MSQLFIKTTPAFDKDSKKVMSKEALTELFDYLGKYPEKGNIISGTNGVRKLRWVTGKNNKGKSGGVRILYHYSKDILVLLIALYEKSAKENITQQGLNKFKSIIPQLVKKYKEDLL